MSLFTEDLLPGDLTEAWGIVEEATEDCHLLLDVPELIQDSYGVSKFADYLDFLVNQRMISEEDLHHLFELVLALENQELTAQLQEIIISLDDFEDELGKLLARVISLSEFDEAKRKKQLFKPVSLAED